MEMIFQLGNSISLGLFLEDLNSMCVFPVVALFINDRCICRLKFTTYCNMNFHSEASRYYT